jgi:hypothetical protein
MVVSVFRIQVSVQPAFESADDNIPLLRHSVFLKHNRLVQFAALDAARTVHVRVVAGFKKLFHRIELISCRPVREAKEKLYERHHNAGRSFV